MRVEPRTYQATSTVGACMAALAVRDAIGVLHGGAGCEIKLHALLHDHDPSGDIHTRFFCTKIGEAGIVLDPGALLDRWTRGPVERLGARLVVVTSASFVEISGLDQAHLETSLSASLRIPVVYVYAPDFSGDLFDGYAKALAAITARFVRDAAPRKPDPTRVNVVGYLLDRPFEEHRANVRELASLLAELGLAVNCVLLDGSPASSLERLPDAGLSVVLPGGEAAAAVLSERLGHPSVEVPFPIGLAATRAFLERIGLATGREAAAAALADREEQAATAVLRQAAEPLKGRRIALFADGAKLHGLLGLCRDVRAVPVLAGVLDGRTSRVGDPGSDRLDVLDDPGDGTVHRRLRELGSAGIDLVVAPAPIATMALRLGIRALEFGFPCRAHQALYPIPYAGYGGVRALAARLLEVAEAGR